MKMSARAVALFCAVLAAVGATTAYTVDCNHEYTDCDTELSKMTDEEELPVLKTSPPIITETTSTTLPPKTMTTPEPPLITTESTTETYTERIEETKPQPRLLNLNVDELQNFANALHNQTEKTSKKLTDLSDVTLDDDDEETPSTNENQHRNKDISDKFYSNLQAPFNALISGKSESSEIEVCKENEIGYKVGEKVDRGCEESCECTVGGLFECSPRCKHPYIRRGRRLNDPLCFESPVDACCSIIACATANGDAKIARVEVCKYNNETYTVGTRWYIGCESTCTCETNSVVTCKPRCKRLSPSEKCINVQDPNDACCEVQVCDVSQDVHELTDNVTTSTTTTGKPHAIANNEEERVSIKRPLVLAEPIGSIKVLQNNSVQVNLMHPNNSVDPIHLLLSDDGGKNFQDVELKYSNLILNLEGGKNYILKTKETGTKFNFTITTSNVQSAEINAMEEHRNDSKAGCWEDGKFYEVGEEFRVGCTKLCECVGPNMPECVALVCPNHVGLEIMSKGCVKWAPSPPAQPPNCCPRSARCLSDGTCHYKGVPVPNWSEVPISLTGCEQRCFCENGDLDCQEVCSPLPPVPPQTLRCPPLHRPAALNISDEDCCKQWSCVPIAGRNGSQSYSQPVFGEATNYVTPIPSIFPLLPAQVLPQPSNTTDSMMKFYKYRNPIISQLMFIKTMTPAPDVSFIELIKNNNNISLFPGSDESSKTTLTEDPVVTNNDNWPHIFVPTKQVDPYTKIHNTKIHTFNSSVHPNDRTESSHTESNVTVFTLGDTRSSFNTIQAKSPTVTGDDYWLSPENLTEVGHYTKTPTIETPFNNRNITVSSMDDSRSHFKNTQKEFPNFSKTNFWSYPLNLKKQSNASTYTHSYTTKPSVTSYGRTESYSYNPGGNITIFSVGDIISPLKTIHAEPPIPTSNSLWGNILSNKTQQYADSIPKTHTSISQTVHSHPERRVNFVMTGDKVRDILHPSHVSQDQVSDYRDHNKPIFTSHEMTKKIPFTPSVSDFNYFMPTHQKKLPAPLSTSVNYQLKVIPDTLVKPTSNFFFKPIITSRSDYVLLKSEQVPSNPFPNVSPSGFVSNNPTGKHVTVLKTKNLKLTKPSNSYDGFRTQDTNTHVLTKQPNPYETVRLKAIQSRTPPKTSMSSQKLNSLQFPSKTYSSAIDLEHLLNHMEDQSEVNRNLGRSADKSQGPAAGHTPQMLPDFPSHKPQPPSFLPTVSPESHYSHEEDYDQNNIHHPTPPEQPGLPGFVPGLSGLPVPTSFGDMNKKLSVISIESDSTTSIKMLLGLPTVLVGLRGSVDLRYTDKADEDVSHWYSQVFAPADEVLTTPRLEFRLTGLKPSTTYKVRGKLFLHNLPVSPESDTYNVRTQDLPVTEEKRKEINSGLTVVDVNDTTAHVSWKHFSEDELQFIDGIQVRYRPVGTPIYSMTELLHHSRSAADLHDLRPGSEYEASMVLIPPPRSNTELHDPARVEFTTAPYIDPYNWTVMIEVRSVGAEAAELVWHGVPSPAERWVRVYRAAHACGDQTAGKEHDEFKLAARDQPPSVTLSGLIPDSRCRVWLELFLTNGKVKTSNVLEIDTKPLDTDNAIDNEIEASGQSGSARGRPRGDYYTALVGVGVVAALGALTSLLLLLVVVRRHRPRSVSITPVPSAPRESSLPPYDNPAYKLELQQETMDL